jgi:thiamine-monophosphate kinase
MSRIGLIAGVVQVSRSAPRLNTLNDSSNHLCPANSYLGSRIESLLLERLERTLKDNKSHSSVGDVGEHTVVEKILSMLSPCQKELLPVGDDAAAISLGSGLALVVKSDMLIAATDVPPGMSNQQIGRKAVTMNFSDLAAKGAKPSGILVSLGLPRNFGVNETLDIMRGVIIEAKRYGACVMGGDTGEASDLIVSAMAIGFAEESKLVRRNGAKPGDVLAVTGPFGLTGAGLKLLLEGMKSDEKTKGPLVKAVFEPKCRVDEGVALATSGCLSSSVDSSDGLAWSIYEISKASKVGFSIEQIPIPQEVTRFAQTNNIDPLDLALYGGEEYELVVTVKRNRWSEAEKVIRATGGTIHRIGQATEGREITLKTAKGETKIIKPKGYEHFKS